MAQNAGRLACPRCGANNFDTVSACWKCSAPLSSGGQNISQQQQSLSLSPNQPATAPVYASTARSSGDSGVARRAAIALAVCLPWIGLPVGWVFMMIEDERKQTIGKVCVMWSAIALVFHCLFMFAATSAFVGTIRSLLPMVQSLQRGQNGGSGGLGIPGE